MSTFYAVKVGRHSGIYLTWEDCKREVSGFSGNKYKSFLTVEEAEAYIIEDYGANENVDPTNGHYSSDVKSKEEYTPIQSDVIKELFQIYPALSYDYEDRNRICVFTMGTSKMLPNYNCIAGIGVFWAANCPLNVSQKHIGIQTCYHAAIIVGYAAIIAVETAYKHGIEKLMIYTNDDFVIKCMTKHIKMWMKNEWKTQEGSEVKHRDDLEKLYNLVLETKINLTWTLDTEGDNIIAVRILAEEGANQHLAKKHFNNRNYFRKYNRRNRKESYRRDKIYGPSKRVPHNTDRDKYKPLRKRKHNRRKLTNISKKMLC